MVYLAKTEDGKVVHHTSLAALEAEGLTVAKQVSDAEFEAAGCLARIVGNKIVLGKTQTEIDKENAAAEIQQIKAEIASRDYRALKAQKLGKPIDELYPGETDWYKEQLGRMDELEAVITGEGN